MHQRVGSYELIRSSSRSAITEKFIAAKRSTSAECTVLLELLDEDLEGLPGFSELFVREISKAGVLDGPWVLRILEVGREGDRCFAVSELPDGPPLASVLSLAREKSARIPLELALDWLVDIAGALAYAHDARDAVGAPLELVHAALSPAEIILAPAGQARLGGLGRGPVLLGVGSQRADLFADRLLYLSPEHVGGAAIRPPSDVFAFGSIAHEVLTGRAAFEHDDRAATLAAIGRAEVLSPSRPHDALPSGLEALIARCLEREPGLRPCAAELKDTLAACVRGCGESTREIRDSFFARIGLVDPARTSASILASSEEDSESATLPVQRVLRSEVESILPTIASAPSFSLPPETERVRLSSSENLSSRVAPGPGGPVASAVRVELRETIAPLPGDMLGGELVPGRPEHEAPREVFASVERLSLLVHPPRRKAEMRPPLLRSFAVILLLGLLSGFGFFSLLIGARSVAVTVRSVPEGATVELDGEVLKNVTPIVVSGLAPGSSYTLRISKQAHRAQITKLTIPSTVSDFSIEVRLDPLEPPASSEAP